MVRNSSAKPIRLTLLSALSLQRGDGHDSGSILAQPKRFALLVYLVLARPRGAHQRDKLLALFWPELDEDRARAALSQSLYVLRRGVGAGVVVSRGADQVGIDFERIGCDVLEFEAAVAEERDAEALVLYAGTLLDGFFAGASPDFENWLDGERMRLRQLASGAAQRLIDRSLDLGDVSAAIAAARRAFELAPSDEGMLRRLLELLVRAGSRAEALAEYDRYARWLADEYEVEPAPATQQLVAALRTHVEAVTMPASLPQATLAPPTPVRTQPARARRGLAVALAVVLLATSAWVVSGRRAHPDLDDTRVAVMPFEVDGAPELAYLREGMIDLLATKLDGAGDWRAVEAQAVLGAAERARDAQEIVRRLNAAHYITGRVVLAGDRLSLTAALHDASGRVRARATVDAADETALFDAVDELTRDLLRKSHDDQRTSLAGLTTPSLPALKAYLTGEERLRRGSTAAALESFQAAVTLDSMFALAHYGLAQAAELTGNGDINERARATARRLGERLPRHTFDVLRAYDTYYAGDFVSAEKQLRELLRYRPELADAWFLLGEVVFHTGPLFGRSFTEAREPFERALAGQPGHSEALLHLLRISVYERQRAESDQLLTRIRALKLEPARLVEAEVLHGFAYGDSATNAGVLERVNALPPEGVWVIANRLAEYTEDLAAVGIVSRAANNIAPSHVQLSQHLVRAQAEAGRGRWRAAVEEAAHVNRYAPWFNELVPYLATLPYAAVARGEAAAIAAAFARAPVPVPLVEGLLPTLPERTALRHYYLGVLHVRAGDLAAAERELTELEAGITALAGADSIASFASAPALLRAHILRAQKQPAQALAALEALRARHTQRRYYPRYSSYSPTAENLMRAELLHELGRDEEALAWAASVNQDLSYSFPYAAAYRLRGDILAKRGDRAGASVAYRKMIELWDDADPALQPVVERARRYVAPRSAAGMK